MFSQMTGAVVRRDQYMMVYNCRKQALGWNGEGETKMLAFMGQVFNLFHLETYARRAPAILFGADYNVAWETLKLHGKFRKQDYRLDGVYETLYFVPLDDMGARLLKLRLLPNADECILDLLFYPEERQNNRLFHADLDGELCLSWLDGDLARLKRFRDYVKSRKGAATEERYRVICFEEQAAFLQAYMGKKVTIQTIPFGDFMNELNDTYQIDV